MSTSPPNTFPLTGVVVTDFDGTMTRRDFYQLALERFLPAGAEAVWRDYMDKKITHFEALQTLFATIRAGESEVIRTVRDMVIDPRAGDAVRRLAQAGWGVFVASAGCEWYIDILLRSVGIEWSLTPPWERPAHDARVTLLANGGSFVNGGGLRMTAPTASSYYHPDTGTDKCGAVRAALLHAPRVVFLGDGPPDAAPALLVKPQDRYAKGWLADRFRGEGVAFHEFADWSGAATAALEGRPV